MNKNLKRDFADAEFLNSRLVVPSTCFDLSRLPKGIRFICCHEDVFSMLLAANLQTAFEKEGENPQLIVSENFSVLVSSNPSIKEWMRFDSRFHDCMALPEECLFIANRAIAQSRQKRGWKGNFAIVEDFQNNDFCFEPLSIGNKNIVRHLKNVDFVVCYDDDVTSAFHAARLWWQLYSLYGWCGPSGERRKVICVGGKGLMSSRLYKTLMKNEKHQTEGRLLARTMRHLFVSADDIIICDKGSNTGENLQEIAEVLGDKTAVAAVTQRLSLILFMSQKQQQPQLKLDYFVIWQSISESCMYLNGMRFASAKPILHYWAHVLRRWKNYSAEKNKFMLPVFGIDGETEKHAARLQPKYVVKQRDFPLLAFFQMLPFMVDLAINGRRAQQEYNIVLRQWQKNLKKEFSEYIYIR